MPPNIIDYTSPGSKWHETTDRTAFLARILVTDAKEMYFGKINVFTVEINIKTTKTA